MVSVFSFLLYEWNWLWLIIMTFIFGALLSIFLDD